MSKKASLHLISYPWQVHHNIDFVLAKEGMVSFGTVPVFIICGGYDEIYVEKGCEILLYEGEDNCSQCVEDKLKLIKYSCHLFGIKDYVVVKVSLDLNSMGKGMAKYALSTIYKRYRVSNINELSRFGISPIEELKAEINQVSAIKKAVERLCLKFKVEFATVFNGRFSPYKAALSTLQEKSIPTIVHEKGKRKDTFCFLQNISFEYADIIAMGVSNCRQPLSSDQRQLLLDFCNAHKSGTATNVNIDFTSNYSNLDSERRKINNYVVYYTSGLEEKISSSSDFSVDGLINDLNAVKHACVQLDKSLVIRHHPNLAALGVNRESSMLLESVSEWASNTEVKVIEPLANVNSYSLAENAWCCIAPNSSMYYQLNLQGIKCLRSTNYIYYGFDRNFRQYKHADSDSIKKILSRVESNSQVEAFINELEKSCYVYVYSGLLRFLEFL